MKSDWLEGIYLLFGLITLVVMALYLVWRQSKPVVIRILLTLAVFVPPLILGMVLLEPVRRHFINKTQVQFQDTLKRCLEDESISDEQLVEDWEPQNLLEIQKNLWLSLHHPEKDTTP